MTEFNPGGATSLNEAVKLRYEANADTNAFTDAEKAKLALIAEGATANATDAELRDRATHTGSQAISTITGLQAALDGKADAGHGHAAAEISDSTAAGRAMLTAADAAAQTALLATFTAGARGLAPASGGGTVNFLRADGVWAAPAGGGGGSGDVSGPASALGNAIARFDGTTGKLLKGSDVLIGDDGGLSLPAVAAPSAPAGDRVGLFGRRIAGRMMPAFIGPSGLDSALQPLLARNSAVLWLAHGNGTAASSWGATFAATGTATARNVATGNLFQRMKRVGYPTAATAGSTSGLRISAAQYTLGTGPDGDGIALGGFTMICRFGLQAVSPGFRFFVGMHNSPSSPTNANPATRTQQIGLARVDGSDNLHIVFAGSSAQSPIDLGTDFPATTTNIDFYEFALFAPPGVPETVGWQVTRLNTGQTASGTLTGGPAVLPSSTTLLAFNSWISNNIDAVAVGIDFASVYLEKDL
jgi:hypothetical protein